MPFRWCQGESTIRDEGEALGRCIPNHGEGQHTAGRWGVTKSTNPPAATSLNPYTQNLPLPPLGRCPLLLSATARPAT